MNIKIEINKEVMERFNRKLQDYAWHAKKDLVEVMNKKAGDVAIKAMAHTKIADKATIKAQLGGPGNGSKFKDNPEEDSFAARIVNARRKAKNEPLLFGNELVAAANKLIASRVRGVGFLRVGWLPAIKILAKATGGTADTGGVHQFKGPKGGGKAAEETEIKPQAIIRNSANKGSARAIALVKAGLEEAIEIVMADMDVYIRKKVNETGAKIFSK